jgi:hypothetical protein
VTASWVARKYGVTRMAVHRAQRAGRLIGIKLRGGAVIYDTRDLPEHFPVGR